MASKQQILKLKKLSGNTSIWICKQASFLTLLCCSKIQQEIKSNFLSLKYNFIIIESLGHGALRLCSFMTSEDVKQVQLHNYLSILFNCVKHLVFLSKIARPSEKLIGETTVNVLN